MGEIFSTNSKSYMIRSNFEITRVQSCSHKSRRRHHSTRRFISKKNIFVSALLFQTNSSHGMKASFAQNIHEDILYEFFRHTLPSTIVLGGILTTSPLNVSSVCHSWRTVALERTNLWASISISLGENEKGILDAGPRAESILKYVEMWLRRSRSSPLQIELETRTPRTLADPEMEKVFEVIISEAQRWGDISLRNVHHHDQELAVKIDSVHLTSLSLYGHPFSKHPLILNLISSPRIRNLQLANRVIMKIPDHIRPQISHLAHLGISAAPMQCLDDIVTLLGSSSNLDSLSLTFQHALVPPSRPEIAARVFARLSELRLTFFESCNTPFAFFISWLTCPALKSLSVSNYRRVEAEHAWDGLEEIDRFLQRSHAPISDLRIRYDELPSSLFSEAQRQRIQAAFVQIIRRLEHLEVLELDFVLVCNELIEALNVIRGDACCPALKSFSLFTSGVALEQRTVWDMVESRRSSGCPLKDIFLDVPSFTSDFEKEINELTYISSNTSQ
ncbi:hypothetical protein SCHPADRAFT_993542 [Schizopora paradoxa]|uniref:F-box domain-containing protein n=1 Tax=Schizopora paradoxa TaxID=27342 RepID=A0A0H2S3D1_9AGAM|nr:hypothetical protein SCHPADRAFT_993542 [Schizopora paradoxa]